jgi:hypothetical protein
MCAWGSSAREAGDPSLIRRAPRIANNGQQGKSPGSEAGARVGFDESNNNERPLSPQQHDL